MQLADKYDVIYTVVFLLSLILALFFRRFFNTSYGEYLYLAFITTYFMSLSIISDFGNSESKGNENDSEYIYKKYFSRLALHWGP